MGKKKTGNGGGDQAPQAHEHSGSGGTRKPPVHEVRLGRIRATVWSNDGDDGPWYSVTLSRSYKQGDEWKTANSYGRDDLLVAAEALRLAFLFVVGQTTVTPLPTKDKPPIEEAIPI